MKSAPSAVSWIIVNLIRCPEKYLGIRQSRSIPQRGFVRAHGIMPVQAPATAGHQPGFPGVGGYQREKANWSRHRLVPWSESAACNVARRISSDGELERRPLSTTSSAESCRTGRKYQAFLKCRDYILHRWLPSCKTTFLHIVFVVQSL